MKTIIFGGSFDPVHNGHILIAKKAREVLNATRVIFLIAKSPRWKNTNESNEDRLNMLKLALENEEGLKISLLEYNSNDEVNYTYNTLLKYERKEDEELYFLFGYDQLDQLHRWYEIEKLSKLVHLVTFNRIGYDLNKENIDKYNVEVIDIGLSSMSSSKLRNLEDLDAPKTVLDYIVEHNLYYIPVIKSYMKEHRYLHTISVANTAYKIAIGNSYSPHKAYLAALLHDIGKEVDILKQEEFVKNNYPEAYKTIQKPLYHQFVGEDIARNVFKINDEEILQAIKYHATGHDNMTTLDKIVYASDKIEPTRPYDSTELIDLCCKDIDVGFKQVLKENVQFFKEKGIAYQNDLTLSCIKEYLDKE